ncbi:hypothetical protein ABIB00_003239 [Bradyrhizobium sp. LB14.3]|uniref:hypothetical protein n=1 Tax=Bradyrhizobium sp. LB14.3 TaxID=3156328 RepID=UPI00339AB8D9
MEVLDAHDNPIDPHSVDWSGTHTPNFTVRQQNGGGRRRGGVLQQCRQPSAHRAHGALGPAPEERAAVLRKDHAQ